MKYQSSKLKQKCCRVIIIKNDIFTKVNTRPKFYNNINPIKSFKDKKNLPIVLNVIVKQVLAIELKT